MKGKGGSVNAAKSKRIVKEVAKKVPCDICIIFKHNNYSDSF